MERPQLLRLMICNFPNLNFNRNLNSLNSRTDYMKLKKKTLLILILWIGNYLISLGQIAHPLKSIISIADQYLVAKINNPIRIIAQQKEPVSIDQLNATFQKYDSEKEPIVIVERNGYFIINPDTIGIVKINITIGDTIETKTIRVKPIEVVGRLGRFKANTDKKISVGEFRTQMGIMASVECCGFDAKCKVLEFQTIRISTQKQTEKALNRGGKFEEEAREIIAKTESGDIFIFRQIVCKCSDSGKAQRLDDMIFEVE
ncbi:MAG: hypothetical protein ACI8YQ_001360 [Polaribacter sp.]|jgi:hypothetical protein